MISRKRIFRKLRSKLSIVQVKKKLSKTFTLCLDLIFTLANKRNEVYMKGLVIKSTGSWYQVLAENGNTYDSRIQGKFRIKDIKSTNPLAVGDHVDIIVEPEQSTAVITKLYPRKNYIIRRSVRSEERRVGKECRYWWSTVVYKENMRE